MLRDVSRVHALHHLDRMFGALVVAADVAVWTVLVPGQALIA